MPGRHDAAAVLYARHAHRLHQWTALHTWPDEPTTQSLRLQASFGEPALDFDNGDRHSGALAPLTLRLHGLVTVTPLQTWPH